MDPKKTEVLVKEIIRPGREDTLNGESTVSPIDNLGQKIIDAINEISSNDIPIKNAIKIFIAYEHGADSEHSVAKITGIDAYTCKIVLDILYKHELLNKGILSV